MLHHLNWIDIPITESPLVHSPTSCDKSLFFQKRVHSVVNTETGEKGEGRDVGAIVPAFIVLGLCRSDRT